MLSWLKQKLNSSSNNKHELDRNMQIEALVRSWFKTIDKNKDRLPDEFIADSVDITIVKDYMTKTVLTNWEQFGHRMVGKEFSNNNVIQPTIGALYCAVMHYSVDFKEEDRVAYIGAVWFAMCFELIADTPKYSSVFELNMLVNLKDQLLKVQKDSKCSQLTKG
ncbi:hypothetical protein [Vibrio alginolyticus]